MPMTPEAMRNRCCPTDAAPSDGDLPKLEDLIPIAVVIAAGCEGCAERMVRRAVEAGSAERHVRRTIAIVADLRERECFRANIAPEVVERMNAPVAKARKTLDELAGRGTSPGAQCCA
jgi:alkylhydroperoxidase/carboxymuconolactone decarboxylase family protein YurZ